MSSGDEYYAEPMSKEMLEDSPVGGQSHQSVSMREARYKICGHIKLIQVEWKGALLSTQNMGKYLHKVFKTVVKEIPQDLLFGESGSEVFHFIQETRNFVEVTKLSDDTKKPWLKATQEEIKTLLTIKLF